MQPDIRGSLRPTKDSLLVMGGENSDFIPKYCAAVLCYAPECWCTPSFTAFKSLLFPTSAWWQCKLSTIPFNFLLLTQEELAPLNQLVV